MLNGLKILGIKDISNSGNVTWYNFLLIQIIH